MDIIKKNMWSIVCGVVAVLAVASTYWPLGGKFEELNAKLDESAAHHNKFKQINSPNLNLPVIDPKTSEVKKLGQFPTDKVIAKGVEVVGKIHTESEKLQKKAMEMNQRQQLVLNALPAGRGRFLSDFKDEYYHRLNKLKEEMNATTIPTELEINEKIAQVLKDDFEPLINRTGDLNNENEVRAEFEVERKELPKRMRRERAQQHAMYINPDRPGTSAGMTTSFDYHPGIPPPENNKLPDIIDVWSAQLGFWIQEDVVRAIVETNKAAADALPNKGAKLTVDDAIVKRLVSTRIAKDYITKAGPLPIATALAPQGLAPAAAEEPPTLGAPKAFNVSATGRVCNPSYDVMHFEVNVDADAQQFQTFMNNLTRDKFITILRVNMIGVDRERMAQNQHYYYGKNPVVRLNLKCEAIFFRSWTVEDKAGPLMPVNVQKILKIPQAPGVVAVR